MLHGLIHGNLNIPLRTGQIQDRRKLLEMTKQKHSQPQVSSFLELTSSPTISSHSCFFFLEFGVTNFWRSISRTCLKLLIISSTPRFLSPALDRGFSARNISQTIPPGTPRFASLPYWTTIMLTILQNYHTVITSWLSQILDTGLVRRGGG